MKRTILYYPTINIPNSDWLRHALLYYDEVSSIVPQSYDNRILIELSPEIEYLIDEGQFRAIKPDVLMHYTPNFDAFREFCTEFNSLVCSGYYRRRIEQKYYGIYHPNRNHRPAYNFYKIHRDKVSMLVTQNLYEKGLAIESNDNEWILFEENTALVYMSLLAKYLANVDNEQTTIGTNNSIYESLNFKKVSKSKGFPVVSINLEKILPSPSSNVSFEDILNFKRRRKDNLNHFKIILADFHADVAKSESRSEVAEICMKFQENVSNGVNDLNAVLRDGRIETLFKGLKVLINKESTTPWVTAIAFANKATKILSIPQFLEVVGIGAIGALEIGTFYIEERNKRKALMTNSPFSYVHYANKAGLINPA